MFSTNPPSDLETVLDNEIKFASLIDPYRFSLIHQEIREWHFHIYFLQNNATARAAALQLRDSVLRLRSNGAFVAVPLFRVNQGPVGPHPIGHFYHLSFPIRILKCSCSRSSGSYEIWVPAESFASVFSYLALNRGQLRLDLRLLPPGGC